MAPQRGLTSPANRIIPRGLRAVAWLCALAALCSTTGSAQAADLCFAGLILSDLHRALPDLSLLIGAVLATIYVVRLNRRLRQNQTDLARQLGELRHTERSLAEAHAQLRTVLDAATQVSIIATDMNGIITVYNTGAERMLGYTADEMIGKRTPMVIHLDSEVAAHGREVSAELGRPVAGFDVFFARAREGRYDESEWTYVRKDGSHLTVNLAITAARDPVGNIIGFLGIAQDITARKQAEHRFRETNAMMVEALRCEKQTSAKLEAAIDQLATATEEAHQANQAKSVFLANMSHELRTPLHGILSFAAFGVKKHAAAPREKLLDYFQMIQSSGQTLLELLNDLLDLAKLEAGKMIFELRPLQLGPLLRSVTDEFQAQASDRNLTIRHTEVGAPVDVDVDEMRIKQTVRNLLSNAVKFSPEGGCIDVQVFYSDRHVLVRVADQGPGIPENELASVFDKFIQSTKTKSGAGGTGLGLAICRQIVAAHRGRVWAVNRPQGGAVFSFRIPLRSQTSTTSVPLVEAGSGGLS